MERDRCYYCGRCLSVQTWARNWMVIQAPERANPEPYEIEWCDDCEAKAPLSADIYLGFPEP